MWFVDDLSKCGRKAQRAKSDADQLPESNGVFHVGEDVESIYQKAQEITDRLKG